MYIISRHLMQDHYGGGGVYCYVPIRSVIYHKNTSCSVTHSLENLKAGTQKVFFWRYLDTILPPQDPKHSSLRPRSICWHQQTPELIPQFPFLQHISYKLPSENRDSNNLLWHTKQQSLLLECAGHRAERTSTNSICLFWHTGREEEPDNPAVVKNDSPAWNS